MEKVISYAGQLILILLLPSQIMFAQTDIKWLRQIHSNDTRRADGIVKGISNSHHAIGFCVPAGELAYGMIKKDKTVLHNGIHTLVGIGINTVITYSIKHIVNRDRPYITNPDIIPQETYSSYSMPSGHTSFSFAVATSVSLQYPKWYVIAPAYLWAGAVGYSRLYMGVHYPSDVLIGAITGAGSAYIVYKANHWLTKHHQKKHNYSVE